MIPRVSKKSISRVLRTAEKWPRSYLCSVTVSRHVDGPSAIVDGAIDSPKRPQKMSRPSLARTPSSRCHSSRWTPLLAAPRRCCLRLALAFAPSPASLLPHLRSWLVRQCRLSPSFFLGLFSSCWFKKATKVFSFSNLLTFLTYISWPWITSAKKMH